MDQDVSPFRIEIPQRDLDDLRARLIATRWPAEAPDTDWVRGVPVSYLRGLVEHWLGRFDWRDQERRLNQFEQFTTTIDAQRIHFVHVRSPEPDARALIITHGWPGSFVEFRDVFGPLTDPRSHGGDPANAFHVVAPSIPGYAFSGPTSEPGWNVNRIAGAFVTLMSRLGYPSYLAQGGDWGSFIAREIGAQDPAHCAGVHLNMLMTRPHRGETDDLTDDDRERLAGLDRYVRDLSGYRDIQATRPQTLAYALTDSPVGLLAWIAEKFHEWTDAGAAVDLDQMLTNVTIYWLTSTAGSSAQLYYEAAHGQPRPAPSSTPTGVAVFPHDIARPIRRLAERTNHIVHWSEFDRGGHFAAMEEPGLLVGDIQAFSRSLPG